MKDDEIQISIPEISIKDFDTEASQILVMDLYQFAQNYRSTVISPHRITFYQIILVTSGNLTCSVDLANFKCLYRNLIAFSKGQVQRLAFDYGTEGYIIQFTEEYINRYPEDLKWLNNLELFHPLTNSLMISLSADECNEIETFCSKMKSQLLMKKDFAKKGIIINLLKTLLLILERINRYKSPGHIKDANDWTYFAEFRNSLEEQFRNSRSVQYFSDTLHISPRKLNTITNNYSGQSAKQLIEDRVVLEAKRLLVYTDSSIKEIGHFIGFNDPTNFNKFFKKFAGLPPAEFRDLNKVVI